MKTDLLFSSFPFISYENITLSQMTEMDIGALWTILSNEKNFLYSPTAPRHSRNDAVLRLRHIEALFREKRAVVLGVFSNDKINTLLGTVEITDVSPVVQSVTINFMIHHEYTNNTYARAAITALTKYLFNTIKVNRIQAYILPNNYNAEDVYLRCGFQKEGTIREGFKWPDKGIVDLSIYSALARDTESQAQTRGHSLF